MDAKPLALLVTALLTLPACSSTTASSSSDTPMTCGEVGSWQETYTRAAGDDPLCPEIRGETSHEKEFGIGGTAKCDSGCTCTGGFGDSSTCGGTQKTDCNDGENHRVTEMTAKRVSSTRYSGSVRVSTTITKSGITLACSYDWSYERIGE